MPVVRMPVYADSVTIAGTNVMTELATKAPDADLHEAQGAFNGLSVKDPMLTLAVDDNGPYATVTASEGGALQYWFSGDKVNYPGTNVVRLTAGTTNVPSLNYICALPNGTLTNYTSYPYLTSGTSADARAIMFEVFLMDTNSIALGTGYALRSWTDNFANRRGLGRTSWIGERVRRLPAIWESGVQVSLASTNTSVTDNYIMSSVGVGWQMHSHTIPANTTRTSMWLLNASIGFRAITNLNDITMLPDGSSMFPSVGDCHAINIFAFVESGISPKSTRLMMQLSTGSYTSGSSATKLANCIADASSYDVTGVPVWMQGMTIRVARIVIRRDAGGRTYWVYDRRGQPLGTSGGGSSSSGESDPVFLAWLNGYTSSASELAKITQLGATPISNLSTGAVITVSPVSQKKVYDVSASVPITLFTNNLASLTLDGTTNYEWVTRINYTSTNALSTAWENRIEWINGTPDLTVTGRYEFAFSTSDGVTIQGRQTYPTVQPWTMYAFTAYGAGGNTLMGAGDTVNYFDFPSSLPLDSTKYRIITLSIGGSHSVSNTTVSAGYRVSGVDFAYDTYESTNKSSVALFTRTATFTLAFPPLSIISGGYAQYSDSSKFPLYTRPRFTRTITGDVIAISGLKERYMNELELKAYNAGWRP
jgi:hypothetical protein